MIDIEIFADETEFTDRFSGKKYIGIGCLFVPKSKKDKLSEELSNRRCLNSEHEKWTWEFKNCSIPCKENYHKLNNTEIHHKELISSASMSKRNISKNWLNFVNQNNKENKELIYFDILYLDLDLIDLNLFGNDKNNIYNRFFRTVIKRSLKYFWSTQKIHIKNIYHDYADDKESHEYFPWHILNKLNEDVTYVSYEIDNITFLDSDHRKNTPNLVHEAQLIQFIDLILGATTQILFNPSEDKVKIETDNIIFELIKRLIKKPYNKNSAHHYFKKQQVSIFPKEKIGSTKDLYGNEQLIQGQFHRNIKIHEPIKINQNESLDNWFKS